MSITSECLKGKIHSAARRNRLATVKVQLETVYDKVTDSIKITESIDTLLEDVDDVDDIISNIETIKSELFNIEMKLHSFIECDMPEAMKRIAGA